MMVLMSVKNLPWVTPFLSELGLEDMGDGFWCSHDGSRSLYLGQASLVVVSSFKAGTADFQTQYAYPSRVTEEWLFDMLYDHVESLADHERDQDERLRWN